MLIQDAIDQFIQSQNETLARESTRTLELLCDYIAHFSDLSAGMDEPEQLDSQEWEEPLEALMDELLNGDTDPVSHLGTLNINRLDSEHFRDFLAWFLLREPGINSLQLLTHMDVLLQWLNFLQTRTILSKETVSEHSALINSCGEDAIRVCKAAHILLHFVRLGSGMSPRNREKRFTAFIEGHARIESLDSGLHLGFDNQERKIGPVLIPEAILALLQPGDVLDIELGQRDNQWLIVDTGPIYPACTYVEADLFETPEKVIPAPK